MASGLAAHEMGIAQPLGRACRKPMPPHCALCPPSPAPPGTNYLLTVKAGGKEYEAKVWGEPTCSVHITQRVIAADGCASKARHSPAGPPSQPALLDASTCPRAADGMYLLVQRRLTSSCSPAHKCQRPRAFTSPALAPAALQRSCRRTEARLRLQT